MANIDTGVITANTTTAAVVWNGGPGTFHAFGTSFGSGTAKLQYTIDGTNFIDAGANTTLTASGGGQFYLPQCSIRGVLSGATSPSIRLVTLGNG